VNVVLDTNVLAAAFFSSGGTCAEVYRACLAHHALFRSDELTGELKNALTGKMRMPGVRVEANLAEFIAAAGLRKPHRLPSSACRDPRDLHVLGLADAARAGVIVTGDADLLTLGTFRGIRIMRPEPALRVLTGSPPAPRPYPGTATGGLKAGERRARYRRRRTGRRAKRSSRRRS
jgi:putative PIN family toxin of toxin-antitoxin system